ncbi:MAG: glycerate kinase [Alistipes sp.]|nr:glycerate kinase [Alistipes sp.]
MRRIVVALDSFKGSLTSLEAGTAFAEGIGAVCPDVEVRVVAIADGGEGMAEAVAMSGRGVLCEVATCDARRRPIMASYAIMDEDNTAVIAMAAASGLTLLDTAERNPLVASTYGTGIMLRDALMRGCRKIVVGLGGSATNDCGVGMLMALGYRFYDADGEELTVPIDILERVSHLSDDEVIAQLAEATIVVASDVDSPLYGERGAAHVFAPQKGADSAMVERLDAALRRFATVVEGEAQTPLAHAAGMGAAGGMGYALARFMNGVIVKGVDVVLDMVDFDALIADADLVVTGEGCIDNQTLMGKAPSGVLRRAQRLGIPCIVVGGRVDESVRFERRGFAAVYAVTPVDMPLEEAMQTPRAYENVRRCAAKIAQTFGK